MTEDIDCAVIGAGVVGLAVARALAVARRDVVVLEAADTIGTGTSSRNSEVIHAGIYYPKDSLKARLCVEGRRALYDYCASRGVAHRRCGKLIVATTEEQVALLDGLRKKALANGVADIEWLTAEQACALEPALRVTAALNSPSTGIIDSHGLMLAYRGEAEDHGAMIAFRSPVRDGAIEKGAIFLTIDNDEQTRLRCRVVINSAGLFAQAVARKIVGLDPATIPPIYYGKGSYFTLAGRSPFTRLIYPVPEHAALGIHLTIDMAGQARFGPDMEPIDEINYDVDPRRGDSFYAAVRTYWPGLPDGALQPAYSGIRPMIHKPKEPALDFLIQGAESHGVAGLVNLYGIESPGLTSSLAIADEVLRRLANSE
jgi:L-2-hydroxyglutarate oxidase LhgO